MSKLYCATCKYYDFNTCEGVDWCRLNDEETGICGHCEREFEDLDEATEHYDTVVEENNKLYSLNCEMASRVADLERRLANCIEPKFKIGQEVWVNDWTGQLRSGEIYEIQTNQVKFDQIPLITYLVDYYGAYSDDDQENDYFEEKDVFATEAEAKAKLEEMKNG